MIKKILVIVLFLIVAGTGGFFTYKFYGEAKDYKQQLDSVQAQLSTAQAQINEIGSMSTVYQTTVDVKSGDEIKAEDLIAVSVPESTINETQKIVPEDVIGRKFRLNMKAGTTMTTDFLMTEEEAEAGAIQKFPRELTFDSLPVDLKVGDFVDVRLFLVNGEEYVVLDHAIVQAIYDKTVTFYITEDENVLLNSMFTDLGAYGSVCVAYLYKYIEPGNAETVPFYPIASELAQFIRFNPNLTDITRLENVTARKHLDENFIMLSNTQHTNPTVSSSIKQIFASQLSMQYAARQTYLDEQEEAEQNGTAVGEDGTVTTGDEGYEIADPAATGETEVDLEAIE